MNKYINPAVCPFNSILCPSVSQISQCILRRSSCKVWISTESLYCDHHCVSMIPNSSLAWHTVIRSHVSARPAKNMSITGTRRTVTCCLTLPNLQEGPSDLEFVAVSISQGLLSVSWLNISRNWVILQGSLGNIAPSSSHRCCWLCCSDPEDVAVCFSVKKKFSKC